MKKLLAFLMVVVVMGSLMTACKDETKEAAQSGSNDFAVNEAGNTVSDSSDLPDWQGRKLELTMWYGQGTSSVKKNHKAENDVVTPEIFRVTGVKFSEKSFDNGGELMDAKISKIIAADDWPDVVINPERAILEKMIEADMVYELTDLIPKYCPNLNNMINLDKENPCLKSERADGKLYHLITSSSVEYMNPDIDPALLARVKAPVDPIGFVYVRD